MSQITDGKLVDPRVAQKIYKRLHRGKMATVNGIVVHQTGAATAQHTFNSYTTSSNGAHFLIDVSGRIYQTALVDQKANHVGNTRSRCIETKLCSKSELSAVNAIYNKKGSPYPVRVKNVHDFEKSKSYPARYPSNEDSIGIELVGEFDNKANSYVSVNAVQNASLKWLVNELLTHLKLKPADVYRHPEVSYKQPSEARTATW